jgi:hypothetical protein
VWQQQPWADAQVMEQVWFAGTHGDVGGGYSGDSIGLQKITLRWMKDKARAAGLALEAESPLTAEELSQFARDPVHPTEKEFPYQFWTARRRPVGQQTAGNESVSSSVVERMAADPGTVKRVSGDSSVGYCPLNVVGYAAAASLSAALTRWVAEQVPCLTPRVWDEVGPIPAGSPKLVRLEDLALANSFLIGVLDPSSADPILDRIGSRAREADAVVQRLPDTFESLSAANRDEILRAVGIPSVEVPDAVRNITVAFWSAVVKRIPEWSAVGGDQLSPDDFRGRTILGTRACLVALAAVGNRLIKLQPRPQDWEPWLKPLAEIDWQRSNPAWAMISQDGAPLSRRALQSVINEVATKLKLYGAAVEPPLHTLRRDGRGEDI